MKKPLLGTIQVPGDKSISHRALMLGAIAQGPTRITGLLMGEDNIATLNAIAELGVDVVVQGEQVIVHGVGLHGLQAPENPLDMGNSGTGMRLLAGLLAAQPFHSELIGDESLIKRPMSRIIKPLQQMGATIHSAEHGCPPLHIEGQPNLQGITYELPMASAQVKSCLMLAGLYAQGETKIVEPAPSRDHTERMMKAFGVNVSVDKNTIILHEQKTVLNGIDIIVPGDVSSAAFFIVAATIVPGSELLLTNVGVNPTRTGVIDLLKLMGADITLENQREQGGEPVADIKVNYAPLHGIDIPEKYVPLAIDEFPILLIAAACAKGKTTLMNAAELRVKETDRIEAMAKGLTTLGIQCEVLADGIIVEGGQLQGGIVDSFGDHRIAMSFLIANKMANNEITVKDCDNINTSFPNFFELLSTISSQECD